MRTKRLWIIAWLCILCVSLTACKAQVQESVIHINEKPAEINTLNMFFPVEADLSGTDSFRDLILTYNDLHRNIKINVDSVATIDEFDRFLEERLDLGAGVDAFIVNAETVKNIARKGQFYDLSALDKFQSLTASAKEQAVVDGTAYTIPLKMAVYVMDVNVSLLERNGLEVPENYDEFMHCCQVLKERGITPIAINRWWAMAVPVMARGLYPVYQAENREELIAGLNSGDLKIGDYMIDGFRMFEEFLDKGYYGGNLVMEEVDAIKANTQDREDFYNAKAAFRFCYIEGLNASEPENGDECMFVPIPLLPDGGITLPSISTRLCINASSTNLEETVDFVEYLVSQREEFLTRDASGSLSPFHSTATPKMEEPWQRNIQKMIDAGHQIPLEDMNLHFGYWDNTRKLCLAMVGGMSAEEAAEQYNRIQTEELRAYRDSSQGGGAGDR